MGGGGNVECYIKKKKLICNTHGGAVKQMKFTSKKWGFVPRLDMYAYLYPKVTKYLCIVKRSGLEISPTYDTCSDAGGANLGTCGHEENNGSERESSGLKVNKMR